ncbi:LysR substrate-binding domain-containing protein [Ahrensia sp. R2A130]|uniref:LysR substrate-binding domain-containing protein n=1 Tax=Ahrensia sp. R2A130 TaxID=744979 RepID=UPI0001E0D0D8|nr:LysR substrate-binding domain-containing protein [Ahrensia sp. R2A130]EFL89417.1 LysR family transcriptional regulator [Ahrensia sp. R2A130]
MNIRDLDLNLLFVFEAIYSTGNISHAARQLELSQPAVSNALTRLRKQIDDPLFVREGNGVVPTSRAVTMIDPIREALQAITRSIGNQDDFDPATSKRQFRLIVADPLEQKVMPALLNSLPRGSNISFELLPPQFMNIEDALQSDKADLAVFLLPARRPELVCEALTLVDLVLIVRVGHPRIVGDKLTPQEIAGERFVTLNVEPGKLANSEKITLWQRLQQKAACRVHKVSSIPSIVASTDLVGLVPRLYAEHLATQLNLRIVDFPSPLSNQQFQLVWHQRTTLDKGDIWLRDTIRSEFSRQED